MSEDDFPPGVIMPGEEDLPVSPQQFSKLPLFQTLEKKPNEKMCRGAFVLRIFKEAGQVICKQGTAGMSAYFILNEADVYGLYAFDEKRLQEAETKLRDPKP